MTPKRIALIAAIVSITCGAALPLIPYLFLDKVDAAVRGTFFIQFFIIAVPGFVFLVGLLTIISWLGDAAPRSNPRRIRR